MSIKKKKRYGGISVGAINSQVLLSEAAIEATFQNLRDVFNYSQVRKLIRLPLASRVDGGALLLLRCLVVPVKLIPSTRKML